MEKFKNVVQLQIQFLGLQGKRNKKTLLSLTEKFKNYVLLQMFNRKKT